MNLLELPSALLYPEVPSWTRKNIITRLSLKRKIVTLFQGKLTKQSRRERRKKKRRKFVWLVLFSFNG